jgi:hypothetical protein
MGGGLEDRPAVRSAIVGERIAGARSSAIASSGSESNVAETRRNDQLRFNGRTRATSWFVRPRRDPRRRSSSRRSTLSRFPRTCRCAGGRYDGNPPGLPTDGLRCLRPAFGDIPYRAGQIAPAYLANVIQRHALIAVIRAKLLSCCNSFRFHHGLLVVRSGLRSGPMTAESIGRNVQECAKPRLSDR